MIPYFNSKLNARIRIFISSTFRDMQGERDVIVNSVFPRLRREFRNRMTDIMEIDLRWGIDEADIKNRALLEICIGETLHCSPYFVGLIGDCYGTIAEAEDIQKLPPAYKRAIGMKSRTDIPKGVSLTELEMRAGAFVKENTEFSRFFIRNGSRSDDDNARLSKIEQTLSDGGFSATEYAELSEFEEQIYTELHRYIGALLDSAPVPPISDAHYFAHLRFLKENCDKYVPCRELDDEVEEKLSEGRRLWIRGEKGTGKSSLLSHITEKIGEKDGGDIFFHFADADGESISADNVKSRLRLFLSDKYAYSSAELSDIDAIADILQNGNATSPVTVCVDAVEKFVDITLAPTLLGLTELSDKLTVILTSTKDNLSLKSKEKLHVLPLTEDQIRNIAVYSLQNYGKKLTPPQMAEILGNPNTKNPLFLSAMLSQLIMYGHHESFAAFFSRLSSLSGFSELFGVIIEQLKKYFTERGFSTSLIDPALSLIVYSEHGICESELAEILGITPIERSVFLAAIELFISESDSLIRFNHDLIISTVKESLPNGSEIRARTALANYFGGGMKAGYLRQFAELPYQLYKLNRLDELRLCFAESECVNYLLSNRFTRFVSYLTQQTECQKTLTEALLCELSFCDLRLLCEALTASGCHYASIAVLLSAYGTISDKGAIWDMAHDYKETPGFISEAVLKADISDAQKSALLSSVGRSYYKLGADKFRCAVTVYEKMLSHYKSAFPSDEVGYASREYFLGICYKSMGEPSKAFSVFRSCAEIYERANVRNSISSWIFAVYGNSILLKGDISNALRLMERSVKDAALTLGEDSGEYAWAESYKWAAHYMSGQKAQALLSTESAYKIYQNQFGERGPKIAWAASNLGVCKHFSEKHEDARRLYMLSIRENNAPVPEETRPHVYTLTAYANLAALEFEMKNTDEAIRLIEFALQNSRDKNGEEHLYTANILLSAGIMKQDPVLIKKAALIYSTHDTPDVFFAELSYARILASIGEEEEAEAVIEKVFTDYSSRKFDTGLISYLILDTLEKISWSFDGQSIGAKKDALSHFKGYSHYITHNNTSQLILIPKI